MKLSCIFLAALLAAAAVVPFNSSSAQHQHINHGDDEFHVSNEPTMWFEPAVNHDVTAGRGPIDVEGEGAELKMRQENTHGLHTLQIAGSRLPDCSHACGSCSPCRLVSVGNVRAVLAEAESCPISHRCMCKNKPYPVP